MDGDNGKEQAEYDMRVFIGGFIEETVKENEDACWVEMEQERGALGS